MDGQYNVRNRRVHLRHRRPFVVAALGGYLLRMAQIALQTPTGFRFRSTLLSHGWIDLAPFGFDEAYTRLDRTHQLAGGRVIRFSVREGGSDELVIDVDDAQLNANEEEEIRETVHRIFRLDLDLTKFYDALRAEERYRWVEEYGAGRLLRAPTVWEDLVKTLLTTNTTWAMTRAMVRRLTALGDPVDGTFAGSESPPRPLARAAAGSVAAEVGMHAFPRPEQIAAMSLEELDDLVRAGYRSDYLHELARKIAEDELDVESWATVSLSADELYGRIKALSGFGPYAAGAVLKLLGKFDRLAVDSAARSMFAREFAGGERALDAAISKHYEPFAEWRGLVMWMDLMGPYLFEHT